MGVNLYKLSANGAEASDSGQVSYDDSLSNPIVWESTQKGGVLEHRLYVRNDDSGISSTDITIEALYSTENSDYATFLFANDVGGSPDDYVEKLEIESIPEGEEKVIWIKATIDQAVEIGLKSDIKINVKAIIHTPE